MGNELSNIAIFLGTIIGLVVLLWSLQTWVETSRVRSSRREFLEGGPSLSESDFLTGMDAHPADARIFLAIRSAMAECCRINTARIQPDNSMAELSSLPWNGLDTVEFELAFLRAMEIALPVTFECPKDIDLLYGSDEIPFREFARRFAAAFRDWYDAAKDR